MTCWFTPEWVNAASVVVLVAVTAWYAASTARMLRAMRDQVSQVEKQSKILAIAAQIAAVAPLTQLMYDEGKAKERLRELGQELEKLKS